METSVEVVPMEVTPLRQHRLESTTNKEGARRETTSKRGVTSPSYVEILDRAGELDKARVPEASRPRAK